VLQALQNHTALLVVLLLGWVLLYLVYKVAWRRDFGMPVERRLTVRRLVVERNQVAYVPLWWSDLQIQRAIDRHYRDSMQRGFDKGGLSAR
jgi:hypothetical protein